MMRNVDKAVETISKEMWFICGVSDSFIPKDDSVNARIVALSKNQQVLHDHIDILRTYILDLDRRLRNSEHKKGKWWNK